MSITKEELIIRMMPFTDDAKRWYLSQPELAAALKILNVDRFIALGGVSITRSPIKQSDEVVGFFVYDRKADKVKQDFIVNVNSNNKEFILYTNLPVLITKKHVRHINEFLAVYGGNGKYYVGTHHPDEKSLDPRIHARLQRAKEISHNIDAYGPRKHTQQELDDIEAQLRELSN